MLQIIVLLTAILLSGCTGQALSESKAYLEKKDYTSAVSRLTPLAEKGNADAEYALGYLYYYGKGVSQDRTLALSWMQKAADQGQPEAVKALEVINSKGSL